MSFNRHENFIFPILQRKEMALKGFGKGHIVIKYQSQDLVLVPLCILKSTLLMSNHLPPRPSLFPSWNSVFSCHPGAWHTVYEAGVPRNWNTNIPTLKALSLSVNVEVARWGVSGLCCHPAPWPGKWPQAAKDVPCRPDLHFLKSAEASQAVRHQALCLKTEKWLRKCGRAKRPENSRIPRRQRTVTLFGYNSLTRWGEASLGSQPIAGHLGKREGQSQRSVQHE